VRRLLALAVALALGGCQDVAITGSSVCDGQAQAGEDPVDSPFDGDGDGFFDASNADCASAYPADRLDCLDRNPDVHPEAIEQLCNDLDDDCDDATLDRPDEDADGSAACDDCDDADPARSPDHDETTCNDIDDDCDETTPDRTDADQDGVDACDDCDDADPALQTWGTCGCGRPSAQRDCAGVLAAGESEGDGYYLVVPGLGGPLEVWCDMTTGGGGWTLLLTSSDDGLHSWTMDASAALGTDPTLVGSVCAPHRDFKSPLWNALQFTDLLFVHRPSDTWARYDAVGDGTADLGAHIESIPYPVCYEDEAPAGHAMTDGTIEAGTGLCSTDLYFNPGDHEYGAAGCAELDSNAYNGATYGPAWSRDGNHGCPLDDPSISGLGPNNDYPATERDEGAFEERGYGWGFALELNTGVEEAAVNYFQVYAR